VTPLTKTIGLSITNIEVKKAADGSDVLILEAIGADETPDTDDEIFDYSSSKKYIIDWSDRAAASTKAAGQEINYGNVRAQHGTDGAAQAAAKFCKPLDFDDKEKQIRTHVEVVDADAIKKCLKGIYRGLSIKGSLVGKKWKDGKFYRYTVDPTEFSLVDNPANPNATITVIKADGSSEVLHHEETAISKAATILQEMNPEEVEELIVMAEDIKKAAAIEKMKAARKAHDENSRCLGGYCDHEDTQKCAEKVAGNHGKIMDAFKDPSRSKAEKSAADGEVDKTAKEGEDVTKTEVEQIAAAEIAKAAAAKKAAEDEEVAKAAAAKKEVDEKPVTLATLNDMIAKAVTSAVSGMKEEIEKVAKASGRATPILAGAKVVGKTDENGGTEKDIVEKRAEVKADDPLRISKLAAIDREAEPELVKF
jgi:hypothetical protein